MTSRIRAYQVSGYQFLIRVCFCYRENKCWFNFIQRTPARNQALRHITEERHIFMYIKLKSQCMFIALAHKNLMKIHPNVAGLVDQKLCNKCVVQFIAQRSRMWLFASLLSAWDTGATSSQSRIFVFQKSI